MAVQRESNLAMARNRAGWSQGELAEKLQVSQSQISKWEANPEELLTPKLARQLANVLGCDPAFLLSGNVDDEQMAPPDFGAPYKLLDSNIRLLFDYIAAAPDQHGLETMDPPLAKNIAWTMRRFMRRPVIAATGAFDAGKSTLLNVLMGRQVLPTSYQPATRLPTYIMHKELKPDWMKDGETVLIVADMGVDALFDGDHATLRDRVVVAIGNTQTLQEFGTHDGIHSNNERAQAAVVFEDAPILRACTFLDLPGYDESEGDAKTADLAVGRADALLYVSPANGFMRASDFQRLAHILRTLPNFEHCDPGFPTLGNLFIVASHADRRIRDQDLLNIANRAAERCWRDLGDGTLLALSERSERTINVEVIRSRIYPFYRELPERNSQLIGELDGLLGKAMPGIWQGLAKGKIDEFRSEGKQRFRKQIDEWQESLRRKDEMQEALKKMQEQEPQRRETFETSRKRMHGKISEYRAVMRDKFTSYIEKRLAVDALTEEIKTRYKSKKEAMESAGNYLVDTVQTTLEKMCHEYGGFISNDLERELGEVLPASFGTSEKLGAVGSFDVKGTFIGALAGLGTLGALSIWASTCGPLGGYILVAQAVGVLSSLGIPMGAGGAATIISFVATIGGPIVLGLGLAVIAGLACWKLFGDSWQKSMAKKLAKVLEERKAKQTWLKIVDDFWTQTQHGIEHGYETLNKRWQTKLEELQKIVSNPAESCDMMRANISHFEGLSDFFAGLPWRSGA